MKRAWARVVLGWVTSWEVLVLHPFFAFLDSPRPASLDADCLRLSLQALICFSCWGHLAFVVPRRGRAGPDGRPHCVGTAGVGRRIEGPASRMAQSDPAGGTKRACLFPPSTCSSRAFRRYIIMANPTGGSKVTSATSKAGPREPPIRREQIVSFANTLRVRSYQR